MLHSVLHEVQTHDTTDMEMWTGSWSLGLEVRYTNSYRGPEVEVEVAVVPGQVLVHQLGHAMGHDIHGR